MKALQIMATFPQGVLPISEQVFDTVLMTFMSIISRDFDKMLIWKPMLKALVQIGLFVDKSPDSKGASTYAALVIEKLIPLVSLDDHRMPFSLKIEAISEISTTGHNFMLRIGQGLEEAIYAKLFEICVSNIQLRLEYVYIRIVVRVNFLASFLMSIMLVSYLVTCL